MDGLEASVGPFEVVGATIIVHGDTHGNYGGDSLSVHP